MLLDGYTGRGCVPNLSASLIAKPGNPVTATISSHKAGSANYDVWRRHSTGTSYPVGWCAWQS